MAERSSRPLVPSAIPTSKLLGTNSGLCRRPALDPVHTMSSLIRESSLHTSSEFCRVEGSAISCVVCGNSFLLREILWTLAIICSGVCLGVSAENCDLWLLEQFVRRCATRAHSSGEDAARLFVFAALVSFLGAGVLPQIPFCPSGPHCGHGVSAGESGVLHLSSSEGKF